MTMAARMPRMTRTRRSSTSVKAALRGLGGDLIFVFIALTGGKIQEPRRKIQEPRSKIQRRSKNQDPKSKPAAGEVLELCDSRDGPTGRSRRNLFGAGLEL